MKSNNVTSWWYPTTDMDLDVQQAQFLAMPTKLPEQVNSFQIENRIRQALWQTMENLKQETRDEAIESLPDLWDAVGLPVDAQIGLIMKSNPTSFLVSKAMGRKSKRLSVAQHRLIVNYQADLLMEDVMEVIQRAI